MGVWIITNFEYEDTPQECSNCGLEMVGFIDMDNKDYWICEKCGKCVPKQIEVKSLSTEVLQLLLTNNKTEATELMVEAIMENNHIYTTRNDENSEMWIFKEGIYVPEGKTYIQEKCREILGDVYTTHLVNQVISKIEADTFIDQDVFFSNEHKELVPVENGILNVVTKKLEHFTPDIIFFSKMPVKFDETAKCDNIAEFFKGILKNEKDVKVVEEIFGFLLYNEYFIERAIMFYGKGRNGKSKLMELMKLFVGIDNCSEIPLTDLEKDIFAVGELFKKKANLCGDLSKTALRNTGNLRKLTGRDMISGARKFKTRVNFVNTAKMVFNANELPMIYDPSDAWWLRWIMLDFPFKFLSQAEIDKIPEGERENIKLRDSRIIEKVVTDGEMSGLLNLALVGLERLLKVGEFSECFSGNEIKDMWFRRSDSCSAFALDYLKISYNNYITKDEFRKMYTKFCFKYQLQISNDKRIKNILTTQIGAFDTRKKIDNTQVGIWANIDFTDKVKVLGNVNSEGSEGSNSILPYREKDKFPIDQKTLDTPTTPSTTENNKLTDDDIDNEIGSD